MTFNQIRNESLRLFYNFYGTHKVTEERLMELGSAVYIHPNQDCSEIAKANVAAIIPSTQVRIYVKTEKYVNKQTIVDSPDRLLNWFNNVDGNSYVYHDVALYNRYVIDPLLSTYNGKTFIEIEHYHKLLKILNNGLDFSYIIIRENTGQDSHESNSFNNIRRF